MVTYQIQGITDRNGHDKEDEASKRRLGSTYQLLQILSNHPMVLEYITDNQGNPKSGYLQTSTVVDCEYIKSDELYIVTTLNSIYYVKKIGEKMNTIFVNDKLYYINKIDDFYELVRNKLDYTAEQYIRDYIGEIAGDPSCKYTEDDLKDEYDKGFDEGKTESEEEQKKDIKAYLANGMTSLQEYYDIYW